MLRQKLMGGAGVEPVFVEDIFSTWLYQGNGSTQTINNGIDLAGEGGLVWIKKRAIGAAVHILVDTVRGANNYLSTDQTGAQNWAGALSTVTAFNSSGFNLGSDNAVNGTTNGNSYASWTFRKQPKFFDVVTWTGNNVQGRAISHNLGSVPGVVIIKKTNGAEDWVVYHRSVGAGLFLKLNTTGSQFTSSAVFPTVPTDSVFYVGNDSAVNGTLSDTYVAYLFAHNAGGFGLTGTDNVISCGSYTGNGSANGPDINLGYEPQWVLIKSATGATSWGFTDVMRGMVNGSGGDAFLTPNNAGREEVYTLLTPTATGFKLESTDPTYNASGQTYIYIAIRRGPMKMPTTGTSVFAPVAYSGTNTSNTVTSNFATDLSVIKTRASNVDVWSGPSWIDKLRGRAAQLSSVNTTNERISGAAFGLTAFTNTGVVLGSDDLYYQNLSGDTYVQWSFRRAPGTFDEVCYTGNGTTLTVNHNLGAAPELIITKRRSVSHPWYVTSQYMPAGPFVQTLMLDSVNGVSGTTNVVSGTVNQSSFTVESAGNGSGETHVAYLWATNPGVTKVGTYTGNGSSQTINCGFTSGARFVMIKAASTTGNWLVADSARGIVAGNDPALYLNSTAAEVTGFDWIDADSTGFVVNETATIAANTNGVKYIYLSYA
jgi:hypothetical protein